VQPLGRHHARAQAAGTVGLPDRDAARLQPPGGQPRGAGADRGRPGAHALQRALAAAQAGDQERLREAGRPLRVDRGGPDRVPGADRGARPPGSDPERRRDRRRQGGPRRGGSRPRRGSTCSSRRSAPSPARTRTGS
jgi:hypothetical protein